MYFFLNGFRNYDPTNISTHQDSMKQMIFLLL